VAADAVFIENWLDLRAKVYFFLFAARHPNK
jgi:hypothetical protein